MGFIRKNGFGQIEIADIMGNWEHLQLPQPDLFGLEMNLNLQCNQPLEGFFTGSSFLPMFDPKIELPELKLPDILNPRKVWW